MPLLTPDAIKTLRTHEYRNFLDTELVDDPDYLQSLYRRRLHYADSVAMEVYHGLIWMLEAYPNLRSIKPIWLPEVEKDDNSMIVRFRLDLVFEEEGKQITERYGYEECPSAMAAHGEDAYNLMISLGELVAPELWNEFFPFTVYDRKQPYTNVADVEADMKKDLAPFLAKFEQWALENATPEPTLAGSRGPGPRL